jgi:hypothetical protein
MKRDSGYAVSGQGDMSKQVLHLPECAAKGLDRRNAACGGLPSNFQQSGFNPVVRR